jgi:hypothetical protein
MLMSELHTRSEALSRILEEALRQPGERRDRVYVAMRCLAPVYAEALVLRHLRGHDDVAIEAMMQLPAGQASVIAGEAERRFANALACQSPRAVATKAPQQASVSERPWEAAGELAGAGR